MNTIEQITICKLMLSSYIYQHQKVRAAEGLFERLLLRVLHMWQKPTRTETGEQPAKTDEEIVPLFLELDDTALHGEAFLGSDDEEIKSISYRLINRLIPRVVYEIGATAQEPEEKLLKNFFSRLGDEDDMPSVLLELDLLIGEELMKRRAELRPPDGANSRDPDQLKAVCRRAGVWFDVPRVPSFEGMDELIGESDRGYPVLISEMFPINKWIEAYESHRLSLKVYSFSEYCPDVAEAAREALKRVTGITDHEFYRRCRRHREANA
jgi:uncharacterized protein